MKVSGIVVCTTISFLLLNSCSGALKEVTDYTGDITGTVMCAGEPLPSVEVEINPGGATVFTNNYGAFSFGRIQAGSYKLTFRKDGYKTGLKNVTVKAGETTMADISLEHEGNVLESNIEVLDFGKQKNELSFTLTNKSGKLVSWEVDATKLPSWITLSSYFDDIPSKGENTVSVRVERSKVEGASANASINVLASSGQTIAIKVTVDAGTVGEVSVFGIDFDYDIFIVRFEKGENVSYYYTGADNSFDRSDDDIIKYGDRYDTDSGPVAFFPAYPGTLYCLYVLPFNEFGQKGTMQKYEVDLPKQPKEKYTALKDIKSEGTYSVKDVRVLVARGGDMVLSDDKGMTLFPAHYDQGNQYPQAGSLIDITKSEVIIRNGILSFGNPSYTVTGSFDINDPDMDEASRYWESYFITNAAALQNYNTSPKGIVPIVGKGILTSESGGAKYNFALGYGDVKDPKIAVIHTGEDDVVKNDNCYVKCSAFAMGTQDGLVQMLPVYFEKSITPIEKYLGVWDAEAYNENEKTVQTWEGMEIYSFEDEGETWVVVSTWMWTGCSYFEAAAKYNPNTGWIDLLGGYYYSDAYFYFNDPSVRYNSCFYPVSKEGDKFYYLRGGRNSGGIAVLKPSANDSAKLVMTGDYVPDEKGRIAVGFVFDYFGIDNHEDSGHFSIYSNLILTPSSKPQKMSGKSSSVSFGLRHAIRKSHDVEIPLIY